MPSAMVVGLITFLHDLFTAAWVGGMIALGLAVVPAARGALRAGPQAIALADAIKRRLRIVAYVSIVGLWVTGLLLSRRGLGGAGLFGFASPWATLLTVKHLLVLAMVVVAMVRSLWTAKWVAAPQRRVKLEMGLLYLNIVLGTATLAASGYLAALATQRPL